MIIQLAQIVALIPKVRPITGEIKGKGVCEVCMCHTCMYYLGQCVYCGRFVTSHCMSENWGCCKVCADIIEVNLATPQLNAPGIMPPGFPPLPEQ